MSFENGVIMKKYVVPSLLGISPLNLEGLRKPPPPCLANTYGVVTLMPVLHQCLSKTWYIGWVIFRISMDKISLLFMYTNVSNVTQITR